LKTKRASAEALIKAAARLARDVGRLTFAEPIHHVYNPLEYAWNGHEMYLQKFGAGAKRVLFLGMNPGPFGMAQTGVPFGEIAAVRDWLGIHCAIGKPAREHPSRPVTGFDCPRAEVSGQRLWGLFARRFGASNEFFREHLVINYCPLVFMESSGRNRTPDKLPPGERDALFAVCDEHLRTVCDAAEPEWVVGVGAFAAKRASEALSERKVSLGAILHPSPASPAANRNWSEQATQQLIKLRVWKP
jgi:single-strand selective monofunctional uracil DNA glycosylase